MLQKEIKQEMLECLRAAVQIYVDVFERTVVDAREMPGVAAMAVAMFKANWG